MAATSGDSGPQSQLSSTTPGVNEIAGEEWTVLVSDKPAPYDVTGQCMYCAEDRKLLLSIARQELTSHGFHWVIRGKEPGA